RCARGFSHRLAGAVELRKFYECVRAPASEIQVARARVWRIKDTIRELRLPTVSRPTATDMISTELKLAPQYRLLSGAAHGHFWAVAQLGYRFLDTDTSSGVKKVTVLKDVPPQFMFLFGRTTFLAFVAPFVGACRYFGWDWIQAEKSIEGCADRLRIEIAL